MNISHFLRLFSVLFLCISTFCSVQNAAAEQRFHSEQKGGSAIKHLEEYFKSLKRVKAQFVQNSRINAGGIKREERSEGFFLLEKPGKLKWEYQKPEREVLLVTDGLLRYYTPEDKQLMMRKLNGVTDGIGYLSLLMDDNKHLLSSYRISGYREKEGVQQVTLKPLREEENIDTLELHIRKQTGELTGIIFEDSLGNRTDVTFSALKKDKEVTILPSAFTLHVPEGTEIIDMDNGF